MSERPLGSGPAESPPPEFEPGAPVTMSAPQPPSTPSLGSRLHPAGWPVAAWVVIALVAEALRVDYTLGAFSFAPAVALLAGTWLGPRRGALSQAIAVAGLVVIALFFPATTSPGEWGFHIGRVLAAWVAGQVAPPTELGARPSVRIRLVVMSAAVATIALMVMATGTSTSMPGVPGQLSKLFLVAFLVAPAFVVWYAWRIVPEPSRVISYAYSLMPYYALGLAWPWALNRFVAGGAGSVATNPEILFHGYLAHVPGDVIGVVLISYIVCAVNRATLPPPPSLDSQAQSN